MHAQNYCSGSVITLMLTEVIGFFIIPAVAALGARRTHTFYGRKDEKCLGELHAKQRQDVTEDKKMNALIQVLKEFLRERNFSAPL